MDFDLIQYVQRSNIKGNVKGQRSKPKGHDIVNRQPSLALKIQSGYTDNLKYMDFDLIQYVHSRSKVIFRMGHNHTLGCGCAPTGEKNAIFTRGHNFFAR